MRGLIQAEGYHPKEQLLRQAGPHLFRQGRRRCQEKADMQSERQVDRQGAARKAGAPYSLAPLAPLSVSRRTCVLHRKPAGTNSQACRRTQPAQADVFWVLLFRFSGNCFPSGPASGTRRQALLWQRVPGRWRDRVYFQSAKALEAAMHRLSVFFPRASCGLNYGEGKGAAEVCLQS